MENKRLVWALIAVIVVMALVISYFVIKPKIDKRDIDNQVKGYNLAIDSLLSQLQQQGYIQLGMGNETLYLVPYNPNGGNIPG